MSFEQIYTEIRMLIEQAQQYHEHGQHMLALQSYQRAIPLVPRGDESTLALLLADAGGEHRDCDNYTHAADLLVAALTIVPDGEDEISLRARIKKLLAITFKDIYGPQKPEVLALLEESRADWIRSENIGQEANVLQHIGGYHIQLGHYPEADGILQEALRKAIACKDIQLQGWILDDMADLEIERDQWGLALDYTRKARERVSSVSDLEGEGDTWITEARVLLRMEDTDGALIAIKRALELYTQNKNLRRSIRALRHFAKIMLKIKRVNEALAALHEAVKVASRLFLYRDQVAILLELSKVESAQQNYGLACQHAIEARKLAEETELSDLLSEAEDLLIHCLNEKKLLP